MEGWDGLQIKFRRRINRELIQELNRTKYYRLVRFTSVCLLVLEDNGK